MKVICNEHIIDSHICDNCTHSKLHEHKDSCENICLLANEQTCETPITEQRKQKLNNIKNVKIENM